MDTYEVLSLLFLGGSFLIALLAYIDILGTIQSQANLHKKPLMNASIQRSFLCKFAWL